MDLYIVSQLFLCGALGSFFFVIKDPLNDTAREIFTNVGFGTVLSVGISMIIYDLIHKHTLSCGLAMLLGSLGPNISKKTGEKLINKILKDKKNNKN